MTTILKSLALLILGIALGMSLPSTWKRSGDRIAHGSGLSNIESSVVKKLARLIETYHSMIDFSNQTKI